MKGYEFDKTSFLVIRLKKNWKCTRTFQKSRKTCMEILHVYFTTKMVCFTLLVLVPCVLQ